MSKKTQKEYWIGVEERVILELKGDIPTNGISSGGNFLTSSNGIFTAVNVTMNFTGQFTKVTPQGSYAMWSFTLGQDECYDLSGYNSFELDFIGVSPSFYFSVEECDGINSIFTENTLIDYVATDRKPRHATIPFSDFLDSYPGSTANWKRIKSITFVFYIAKYRVFSFNNFVAKPGCAPSPSPKPITATTTLTTTKTTTAVAATTTSCSPNDLIVIQDIPVGGLTSSATPYNISNNANGVFSGVNYILSHTGLYTEVTSTDQFTYFSFSFGKEECVDLSGYSTFEMDIIAPSSGFYMSVEECDVTLPFGDFSISEFADGKPHHVVIPFDSFKDSLEGLSPDWKKVKTVTFVIYTAKGRKFSFNNFVAKGSCGPTSTKTTRTTTLPPVTWPSSPESPSPAISEKPVTWPSSPVSPSPSSTTVETTTTILPSPSPSSSTSKTTTTTTIAPSPSPQKLGEWEFCTSSSQCLNNCCSKEYSNDGKYKCTPGSSQCVASVFTSTTTSKSTTKPPTSPSPIPASKLKDWDFCTSSSQCVAKCCSKQYSDDGKLKCTPGGSICV
ncbi:hypothetical protein HK098_003380 [Nowakowskiella sp. JEL0407]|nr:hypothetical protein HK098_003380 [Nowakowskiella sp. JEL0407]